MGWMIWDLNPSRGRRIFLFKNVRTSSRGHLASYSMGTGALSWRQRSWGLKLWVTVCCYCEITTTVNTLTSVFILVGMYRLLLYTVVRVGCIYKCFSSDIVAAKGRLIEVRQTLLP
jgi:hypothetical protein